MKNVVLSLVVGVLFGLSLPQVAMALTPQELVEQQHRIDEARTQADQEAFKQRQNNPAPSACQVAWNSSSAAATCRLIGNAIQQQSDGSCQLQVSCSQAGTRPVEVWANNAAGTREAAQSSANNQTRQLNEVSGLVNCNGQLASRC